jgi:hypothetical protein
VNRRTAGIALGTILMISLSGVNVIPQSRHDIERAYERHPKIAVAIQNLQEAISFLEASRDDFGGHKAAAIRASKAAVFELQEALKYRAVVESHHHHDH